MAGKGSKKTAAPRPALKPGPDGVVRLSGGNPQIAKGYGDAVVQSYIAAMPGWQRDIGRRIDAIIGRVVPAARKAVKWNSPFWGAPDREDWFVSLHCMTKYVKVTFFAGAALDPPPLGKSKYDHVRYLDIHEDGFDEAQFADWMAQASRLPGEKL